MDFVDLTNTFCEVILKVEGNILKINHVFLSELIREVIVKA